MKRTLFVGVAIAVIGAPLAGARTVAAQQASNTCTLLTLDEIQKFVPQEHVSAGIVGSVPSREFSACRYTWGAGVDRFSLQVSSNPSARAYVGMSVDAIKKALLSTVVPETADEVITDVGDAAVFTSSSPVYAGATALVKGRILHVYLDGLDARDHKGQLISLLKSAASRT